jgi:hypothetical protein
MCVGLGWFCDYVKVGFFFQATCIVMGKVLFKELQVQCLHIFVFAQLRCEICTCMYVYVKVTMNLKIDKYIIDKE